MYAKLFRSMYEGSLGGDWKTLVTFQQLLVLSDQYGVVDMFPPAIASITGIPIEIIEHGIARLEQPDKYSRTPDEEGRRIVRLDAHRDWGWRIVNFAYYRQLQRHEERREYMKDYMKKRRAKASVNSVSHVSAIAEAEAEAEVKTLRSSSVVPLGTSSSERGKPDGLKTARIRNAVAAAADALGTIPR